MANEQARASSFWLMEIIIKATFLMGNDLAKAILLDLMDIHMKVSGKMIKNMGKEKSFCKRDNI